MNMDKALPRYITQSVDGDAGPQYAHYRLVEITATPGRIPQKTAMWAVCQEDENGDRVWVCNEEGNRGEETTERLLNLNAASFPIGCMVEILE